MAAVTAEHADRRIAGAGTSAAAWLGDAALAAVPAVDLAGLVPAGARAVLVAPHPDDEVLAWGGLLQLLAARGGPPGLLVAVTDGEASHPHSARWPRERLRAERPRETSRALSVLGGGDVHMARLALTRLGLARLGHADGGVTAAQGILTEQLGAMLAPGDVVFTTWRHDGHPDHEACARACLAAAARRGASVIETPVWGWHWNSPEHNSMPLARARTLALSAPQLALKRAALAMFVSQLEADTSDIGDTGDTGEHRDSGAAGAPILPASALERLLTPFELFFL